MTAAKTKETKAPKAFGDSDTDRRVSGLADRRINTSTYKFEEFPKAVYHKDGQQSRIVKDQAEMDALDADWGHDVPDIHGDAESHEAAVLKGDGVPRNQNVQKVEVVNPKDDAKAAAFQQPKAATAADLTPAEQKAADKAEAKADKAAAKAERDR